MGLAERADLIVDFTNVPVGNYVLGNVGPDEPFGGGIPGVDFDVADPASTGQVHAVPRRAGGGAGPDHPAAVPGPPGHHPPHRRHGPAAGAAREADVGVRRDDVPVEARSGHSSRAIRTGPACRMERKWMDPVTENPAVGATEVWEFYNTTADAHPMHIHEVAFQVVDRQGHRAGRGTSEVVQPIELGSVATRHPSPGRTAGRTPSSPTRAR